MHKFRSSFFISVFLISLLISCSRSFDSGVEKAISSLTSAKLKSHILFLSDDLLEGRSPGSRGGELAARYIASQFEAYGLIPAGENDTYFQPFSMIGITPDPDMTLTVQKGSRKVILKYLEEFTGETGLQKPLVTIDDELVFAGYGIEAPEYDWDDYKGVDVKGKILLMLVNDPPSEDPQFFGGKALTYYGRWTYKYEKAAEKGAKGAILIHTTESAGYPWKVVQSSWSGEQYELERGPDSPPSLPFRSWVKDDAAEKFLALAGTDLSTLKKMAESREFRPIFLGLRVKIRIKSTLRSVETANVVGLKKGGDQKFKNEYVILTAHYDHLGVGKPVNGDSIYNGALDNATGVSVILSIADGLSRLSHSPKRSILFIATSAEESGLLGSKYYSQNPIFPLEKTAAVINIDGINIWGPTRDIIPLGANRSTMEGVIAKVAQDMGLVISPDPFPEQGFFYRSDQFNFAKMGVPSVSLDSGIDFTGKPEGWGKKRIDEYIEKHYHQPSDEFGPEWNLNGTLQLAQVALRSAIKLANWSEMPQWKEGDEFKTIRERMLKEYAKRGEVR